VWHKQAATEYRFIDKVNAYVNPNHSPTGLSPNFTLLIITYDCAAPRRRHNINRHR
jgi:hypothetical protein